MWRDDVPGLDVFAATDAELDVALFGSKTSVARPDSVLFAPSEHGLDAASTVERRLARARALAGAARFLWPIPDRGLSRRAHRIGRDTLLIWGGDDGLCPVEQGVALAGLVEGSRLQVLDGVGHLPQYSAPEAVLSAVTEFLEV